MKYTSSCSVVVNAPLEKIWSALTRPEIIKQYFFGTNLVTDDWKVGSPLFFRGEWEGKAYEDRGKVLSFEPLKSLSFDYWSAFSGLEDRPELRQIIRYDLLAIREGVQITVHQSNCDTQERADHSMSNWKNVLQSLKKLLEERATAAGT